MIYWISNLAIIGLASFLLFKRWKSEFPSSVFWAGLLLKLSAGLVVGWIFLNEYSGADTFSFFEKAKELLAKKPGDYFSTLFSSSNYEVSDRPRVLFFTKLLSSFVYISGGSYWITALHLSFVSFVAFWWSLVRLQKMFRNHKVLLATSILFIPTIIFWSSGILKDSIASAALLIAVTSIITFYKKQRLSWMEVLYSAISIFTLFNLKHYVLITLLIFAGLLFFLHYLSKSRLITKLLAFLIIGTCFIATQYVHPYLNLERFPLTLYENNQAIIKKTAPKNQISLEIEEATWSSVWRAVPQAIRTGLFRPSIFDNTPLLGWLHKLENLVLAVLTVGSILIWIKERPSIDFPLTVAAIGSILLLTTLLALSTPNFGTLVRYKNVLMPFFFLLASILPYQYITSKRME